MADIVDAVAENFCVIVIFREVFGTNLLLGRLGSSGHLGSQQDVITGTDRIMEKKNVSIYRRRLSMIEKLRTFFFP